jgi:hypothetical protein
MVSCSHVENIITPTIKENILPVSFDISRRYAVWFVLKIFLRFYSCMAWIQYAYGIAAYALGG